MPRLIARPEEFQQSCLVHELCRIRQRICLRCLWAFRVCVCGRLRACIHAGVCACVCVHIRERSRKLCKVDFFCLLHKGRRSVLWERRPVSVGTGLGPGVFAGLCCLRAMQATRGLRHEGFGVCCMWCLACFSRRTIAFCRHCACLALGGQLQRQLRTFLQCLRRPDERGSLPSAVVACSDGLGPEGETLQRLPGKVQQCRIHRLLLRQPGIEELLHSPGRLAELFQSDHA